MWITKPSKKAAESAAKTSETKPAPASEKRKGPKKLLGPASKRKKLENSENNSKSKNHLSNLHRYNHHKRNPSSSNGNITNRGRSSEAREGQE